MTNDDVVDNMGDVFGLVTARVNDDVEGFKQIVNESESTAGLMLGLSDLCVSLFRVQAAMLGIPVRTLLKTIGIITQAVGPDVIERDVIKRIERGY